MEVNTDEVAEMSDVPTAAPKADLRSLVFFSVVIDSRRQSHPDLSFSSWDPNGCVWGHES